MYYYEFKGHKISALGFGMMRLPLNSAEGKDVNVELVDKMVDYAIANGINYFDTGYMYHEYTGESVVGNTLSRYPRDSYYLATKYPGHELHETYDPEGIFKGQLKKLKTDYFDFYLFHNVNEASLKNYLNPKWGMHDFFKKMKEEGKIGHLGFSCHGDCKCIETFLEAYGDIVEFCQIQLNYLDWTLQDAKDKYALLTERNIPIWVMEPVRGGRLASSNDEEVLSLRKDESVPALAFRFLQGLPNVKVILSGMSNLEQMEDNIKTFSERKPLNEYEQEVVFRFAEKLKNSVPCTGCRYCTKGCPMEIDIPKLISLYNDYNLQATDNINMRLSAIDQDKLANACIGCGQCATVCPQRINIPELMGKMDEVFSSLTSWDELCVKREILDRKNNS